ncbi:hypothetical protein CCM_09628 [Cordyceps militaris CM01]|uniref:Uncharacterized protein n=1 Tax=Cordyceps militaris (strain CM01) TaxID=983644 RepID=G3JUZ1_CORMM|nr:uncharacterized protein CCM_09628 [Cordyceps militaris CM01]EGX87667.1 hypothetical protein CCM_09628 [Cordyceps militaris CM01]
MTRHTYQRTPPPTRLHGYDANSAPDYNWRLQCVQCGKKPINADAYIYHSCDGMKPDTEERKSRIQFVDDKLAEQQRTDDRPSMIACQPATEGLTTAAMMVQEPVHQAAGLSAKDDSAIHASQYQRESIWTQPGQDLALYFDYGEEARRAACEGAGQNPPIGAVPFDRVSLWQAPM